MRAWANRIVGAIALTSAFFYPLAAAVGDQIFYLHWQPRHSAELVVASVVLTLLGVLLLTPVSVIVLVRLATLASYPAIATKFNRSGPAADLRADAPRVLVLLFDELSFRSLYDGGDIRPAYPHLRAFGAHATHYHVARA